MIGCISGVVAGTEPDSIYDCTLDCIWDKSAWFTIDEGVSGKYPWSYPLK